MKLPSQRLVVAAITAVLYGFLPTANAQDRSAEFQNIKLIPVGKPITHISNFTPDGSSATIFRAVSNIAVVYMVVLSDSNRSRRRPPDLGVTVPIGADRASE